MLSIVRDEVVTLIQWNFERSVTLSCCFLLRSLQWNVSESEYKEYDSLFSDSIHVFDFFLSSMQFV